ncbi:MAG: nucleotidyl transferase AbiEii/AbiGii toxin family protein [Candidatus Methanoperedens sp.]|nr:nucleotidyl transferase AbiEii/AbiGii toxin family protein [Candidatus Methanoperedens sp.]
MRINFSPEEKLRLLSTIQVWRRDQLTQDVFRKLQVKYGIPAYLIETLFWHLEILDRLQPVSEFLVFKGGTCVQSYIDPMLQRASNDLDFNTIIENPNALMQKIEDLNTLLKDQQIAIEVQGIQYGIFELESRDAVSGTLNYRHRMPSRFGEYERVAGKDVQAKSIRVQINYKHSWLPAIKKVTKPVEFLVMEAAPVKAVVIPHASIEDLIVDKLLATNEHTGRERFKDVYDLMVLLSLDYDRTLVNNKLALIARRTGRDAGELIKSSASTVMAFGERADEARGFSSMVARGGKELIKNWEMNCEKTAEEIIRLV